MRLFASRCGAAFAARQPRGSLPALRARGSPRLLSPARSLFEESRLGNSPLLVHHFFFFSSQTNCVCGLKWRWWEGRLGRAGEREGWRVGKLQSTFQKLPHVHQRHLEHMQLEQLTKFLPRQVVCNFTSFLPLTVRRPRRRGEARGGGDLSSKRSPLRSHLSCKRNFPSPALPGGERQGGEEEEEE